MHLVALLERADIFFPPNVRADIFFSPHVRREKQICFFEQGDEMHCQSPPKVTHHCSSRSVDILRVSLGTKPISVAISTHPESTICTKC